MGYRRFVLLGLALWPLSSPAVFGPPVEYELSGTDPTDIEVADFNGDGAVDVAVAMYGLSSGDGKLSVHLNGGDGVLTDHPLAVAFKPYGLAAGDWDGDARVDLAVTEGDDKGLVHLFRGDGTGGFSPSGILDGAGAFPADIVARDFTGDGSPDLAVIAAVGAGVTLFPGDGGGGFATGHAIADALRWQATDGTSADFDGDGRPELALPQGILRSDGAGGFSEMALLGGSTAIIAADIDGDGHPEAAVGTSEGVDIWKITAANEPPAFVGSVAAPSPWGLAGADMDGNGRAELVGTDRANNTIGLIEWSGPGGMWEGIVNCIEPGPVAVADLNGDGYPDVITGCRGYGETAVLAVSLQEPGSTPPPILSFSQQTYQVNETDPSLAVTIQRDRTTTDSRVEYATAPGTALEGSDYVATRGALEFPAGISLQTVLIAVTDDTELEGEEHFTLQLSNPINALIDTATTGITILDDETASVGVVKILNVSPAVSEGAGSVNVTVYRTGGERELAVGYATRDGTAVAGSDYQAVAGELRFSGASEQHTVSVPIIDDGVAEPRQAFLLELSGAPISGPATAEISVLDDDSGTESAISAISQIEVGENAPLANVVFRRMGDASQPLEVRFRTLDGLAKAGKDFLARQGNLIFEANKAELSVPITLIDDSEVEGDESFLVSLLDASGDNVLAEVTVAILDDEQALVAPTPDLPENSGGGGSAGIGILIALIMSMRLVVANRLSPTRAE
ncbi:Calx-beta domain-containing protein [Thiohalomonas denitrificans]|uniref:Calx-beta domain-containing protein n=1 Tax=Thiohalomonas denitrificans TaxID=415747 RepID=UPI0026EDBD0F|nr:Calx-beta domain-containing protein [Thiohalomonas denitrificans]